MSYVYTVNSIGLNIVHFASKRAALNYAIKHNIRCSDGKIRLARCKSDIAQSVREDFSQTKSGQTFNSAVEKRDDDALLEDE